MRSNEQEYRRPRRYRDGRGSAAFWYMAYSTVAATPCHAVCGSINPPGLTGAKPPLRPAPAALSPLSPCDLLSGCSSLQIPPVPSPPSWRSSSHPRVLRSHVSSSRDLEDGRRDLDERVTGSFEEASLRRTYDPRSKSL